MIPACPICEELYVHADKCPNKRYKLNKFEEEK